MKQLKIGSTRPPLFFIPRGLMSSTLGSTSKGYFFLQFFLDPNEMQLSNNSVLQAF